MVHSEGHQAHGACGIGDEREVDHVDHQLELGFLLLVVANVFGFGADWRGFWAIDPFAGHLELAFDVADGFEVFVDALFVSVADALVQAFCAVAHEVEHAAAFVDAPEFGVHFGGCGGEEEFFEDCGGLADGGD